MQELKSVGPETDKLYLQGKCQICEIPLFGRGPKQRDFCGECEDLAKRASHAKGGDIDTGDEKSF